MPGKIFLKIEEKFSQLENESQKTVYHNKVFPIMFVAQLWSALFQEKPKHDSRFQGKFTEKLIRVKDITEGRYIYFMITGTPG